MLSTIRRSGSQTSNCNARVSKNLSANDTVAKAGSVVVIAILASLAAMALHHLPGTGLAMSKLDDLLYDDDVSPAAIESQREGPVVIVAEDDSSLSDLRHGMIGKTPYGFPWPRNFWPDRRLPE